MTSRPGMPRTNLAPMPLTPKTNPFSKATGMFSKEKEDFLNTTKKPAFNPLTQKFFMDMLSLELDMASRNFTMSTIEQLIQLYAKAIEFYDSMKDPISMYFLEKIQITLSSKETLKLIIRSDFGKQEQTIDDGKPEISYSMIDSQQRPRYATTKIDKTVKIESASDDEDKEDLVNLQVPKRRQAVNNRYSISQKKAERAKFVDRYVKVETQKLTTQKIMSTVINQYSGQALKNDAIVKTNLDSQYDVLKKRLENRKAQAKPIKKVPEVSMRFTERNAITEKSFDNSSNGSERRGGGTATPHGLQSLLDELDLTEDHHNTTYPPSKFGLTATGTTAATTTGIHGKTNQNSSYNIPNEKHRDRHLLPSSNNASGIVLTQADESLDNSSFSGSFNGAKSNKSAPPDMTESTSIIGGPNASNEPFKLTNHLGYEIKLEDSPTIKVTGIPDPIKEIHMDKLTQPNPVPIAPSTSTFNSTSESNQGQTQIEEMPPIIPGRDSMSLLKEKLLKKTKKYNAANNANTSTTSNNDDPNNKSSTSNK